MVPTPAINIIMAHDADSMHAFQTAKSFEVFAKDMEGNKDVTIFTNSPQSNFLSLTHSMGMGSSAKGSQIQLEFVDPEGLFEEKMLDISVGANMSPVDNPVGTALETKLAELKQVKSDRIIVINDIREKKRKRGRTNKAQENLKKISEDLYILDDHLKKLKEDIEKLDDIKFEDKVQTEIELLKKQISTAYSQITKPVFIAYGIGDDLQDWAPPQCFGRAVGVEYNFTGDGARTLKLFYGAVGIHPNLTQMGISPLGSLGVGTITKGVSELLFNEEIRKKKIKKYEELASKSEDDLLEVDRAVGDLWNPSFHLAIKEAITEYISRGLNQDIGGVVVVMPNLDILLGPWYADKVQQTYDSLSSYWTTDTRTPLTKYNISSFGAFREVLEELGLQLTETRNKKQYTIGVNVWESLEECKSPEESVDWFAGRKFRAVCQCDNVTQTFQEKLVAVGDAISEMVRNGKGATDEGTPEFSPTFHVETDFYMLKIMAEAGLISAVQAQKPVVIWGDSWTISNFLEARVLEAQVAVAKKGEKQSTLSEQTQVSISETLHYTDVLEGLDLAYMKKVVDYAIPIPWIGPFGPMGQGGNTASDQNFLPEDTNIGGNLQKTLEQLKQTQPLTTPRMPVFAFGTKNPNVTEIAIDINNQYMSLINNSNPIVNPAQKFATAIIPPGFRDEATGMFDQIAEIKKNMDDYDKDIFNAEATKGIKVPNAFKALVDPFFSADTLSQDDLQNFGEWDEVFSRLGIVTEDSSYKDLQENKTFGWNDKESKDKFYAFMWQSFEVLMLNTYPKSDQIIDGKTPSNASVTTNMQATAKMASQALVGSITTVPMFSLSTTRRTLRRTCLLYCVEPKFLTAPPLKTNTTWFTGMYRINGFRHRITNSSADSEFLVSRDSMSGGQLLRKI